MAGHRLLILGGGFGGLDVARSIARSHAARGYWDALLIDKENFFQFNPLLPAIAVGAVETRHIVYPLREMARHRRIRFIKNKVIAVDLEKKCVQLHNGLSEPYDTLVIAVGSVTNWYGVPGAPANARPFKTIVDAMTLRARVVELFEMAEQARSDDQRRRLLSFVIAMLTWRGPMRGFFNPGIILGACFAVAAVLVFALSFRVKPDSWWRGLAGLDEETLRSSGLGNRRSRRRLGA